MHPQFYELFPFDLHNCTTDSTAIVMKTMSVIFTELQKWAYIFTLERETQTVEGND